VSAADSQPAAVAPSAFPLVDPARWLLEVVSVASLTPGVTRVRAHLLPANGTVGPFAYAPGQDLTVSLPAPSGSTVSRRYTVDAYDAASGLVELAVVAHGDGPGARWLAGAAAGQRVEAVGPRGKITLAAGVSTHLFVGDEASFAAVRAIAAAVPAGGRALVLADVAGSDEHRAIAVGDDVALDLRWVHRGDAPAESPTRVLDVLDELDLPMTDTHAYVFGEAHVVAAAARALAARRLDASRISAKPYWRAGRPNADRGEPDREL